MRRCVGKSTAPVTGQSVGQTENAEGVLPSTATETVDDIVLPAAVETAGMAETIDEKAVSGKLGRKKPENMLVALEGRYLRREFSYSKFQQTMVLPENAEKEKIEAKVENGVLNIIIPKMSEEAAKKAEKIIEIK